MMYFKKKGLYWELPDNKDKKNSDKSNNSDNPWGRSKDSDDFNQFVNKIKELFFSPNKKGDDDKDPKSSFKINAGIIVAIAALIALVWLASGFYIIDAAEKGVVTRFGKYLKTTNQGPNWHLPYPIENIYKVNVQRVRSEQIGFRYRKGNEGKFGVEEESLMLTEDENIIDIQVDAQYQVKDAKNFLFNVVDPISTLRYTVQSALREVVGQSEMDYILGEELPGVNDQVEEKKESKGVKELSGRVRVANDTQALVQKILDDYNIGILITSVNLVDAQPPEQVQSAFADAVKAQSDKERKINEAETYTNDIIPKARGNAAKAIQDAGAYKAQVIARAEGDAARFNSILNEYIKAPRVTRERLYLDALEKVLSNVSKVVVNKSNNSLIYLPLDKMIGPNKPKFKPEDFRLEDSDGNGKQAPSANNQKKADPASKSNEVTNLRELFRNRNFR